MTNIDKIFKSLATNDPLGLRNPADMERWCNYSLWSLRQAVTLLMGFEPSDKYDNSFYTTPGFDEIHRCLRNDILDGRIVSIPDGAVIKVRPETFIKWAETYFEKPVYLPFLETNISEYTSNLAKLKLSHEACVKNNLGKIIPYGFTWINDQAGLKILHEGLIGYNFIEEIPLEQFVACFCYGPSIAKIVWLENLMGFRYFIDELKMKGHIDNNSDFCAQAVQVFQQRKKGKLVNISKETLYVSTQWSEINSNKTGKKTLLDTIMRDLKDGKPSI